MSVAEELTRIKAAKQSLKTAINAKGGTLTNELIDQYPAAVENLQLSGPGGSDIDLTGVTVTADTMLDGVVAVDASGSKVTGNIKTVEPSVTANVFTVSKGYVAEDTELEVPEAGALTVSANVVTVPPGFVKSERTATIPEATVTETETAATVSPGYVPQELSFELGEAGEEINFYRCVDHSGGYREVMIVSGEIHGYSGVYDPTDDFTEDWEGKKYPVYKRDPSSGWNLGLDDCCLFYSSDMGQWCLAEEEQYTSGNYTYYGSIGGTWYDTETWEPVTGMSVQKENVFDFSDGTWSGKKYHGTITPVSGGTVDAIRITLGKAQPRVLTYDYDPEKGCYWNYHTLTYFYRDSLGYECISDDPSKDHNNSYYYRYDDTSEWRRGYTGEVTDEIQSASFLVSAGTPAFFLFDDKVTSLENRHLLYGSGNVSFFKKHKVYPDTIGGKLPIVAKSENHTIFDMPCDEAGALCEGLTFYASLKEDLEQAETGQKLHNNGVEITTFRNVRCAGFDGDRRADLRPEWTGLPMANNGSIAPFTMCLTFCATKIDGQRYLIKMYNYFEIYVQSTDQGKVLWINAPGISNFQYVIAENKWYTLSVQRTEKGETIVYLGNINIAYGKSTGTNTQSTYLCLGSYGDGNNAFTGYMIDFRIYNRVLRLSEIGCLEFALDYKLALERPSLIPIGFTSNTSMEGYEINQSGDIPAFELFNNKPLCPDCAFVSEEDSAWVSIKLPFTVSAIRTQIRGYCSQGNGTLYGSNDGEKWDVVGTFSFSNGTCRYEPASDAGYSHVKWVFEKDEEYKNKPITINCIHLLQKEE